MDKPQKVIARRILLNARTPCQARQPQSCQPLGFSPKFGGIPSAGAEPLGYLRTSASRRKEMAYNKNLGKKKDFYRLRCQFTNICINVCQIL